MITWTLIVVLLYGTTAVPINVPGFTTTDACNEAAVMLVNANKTTASSAVCLPSRSQ